MSPLRHGPAGVNEIHRSTLVMTVSCISLMKEPSRKVWWQDQEYIIAEARVHRPGNGHRDRRMAQALQLRAGKDHHPLCTECPKRLSDHGLCMV